MVLLKLEGIYLLLKWRVRIWSFWRGFRSARWVLARCLEGRLYVSRTRGWLGCAKRSRFHFFKAIFRNIRRLFRWLILRGKFTIQWKKILPTVAQKNQSFTATWYHYLWRGMFKPSQFNQNRKNNKILSELIDIQLVYLRSITVFLLFCICSSGDRYSSLEKGKELSRHQVKVFTLRNLPARLLHLTQTVNQCWRGRIRRARRSTMKPMQWISKVQ